MDALTEAGGDGDESVGSSRLSHGTFPCRDNRTLLAKSAKQLEQVVLPFETKGTQCVVGTGMLGLKPPICCSKDEVFESMGRFPRVLAAGDVGLQGYV